MGSDMFDTDPSFIRRQQICKSIIINSSCTLVDTESALHCAEKLPTCLHTRRRTRSFAKSSYYRIQFLFSKGKRVQPSSLKALSKAMLLSLLFGQTA
jgi:hypothetical protein